MVHQLGSLVSRADHERDRIMQLTVLGSGTAFPVVNRSPAGYFLQMGDEKLVLDMGPGTLWRLLAIGINHLDIEKVLISHLHSDHVLDLITLLQASSPERKKPLELIGCVGLEDFLAKQISIFDVAPEDFVVNITEVGVKRSVYSFGVLETELTGHTPNSLAFRIESGGKAFVYSGDAIETSQLSRLAREADVFVCECSYPRGWETRVHVTADGAGRMAAAANVRHLVLTHLYPPALAADIRQQAGEIFAGDITVAKDGMVCEV